jgi:hypothetical protein
MIRSFLAFALIAALVTGTASRAQTTVAPPMGGATNSANFAEHKQKVLGKIQQKMSTLQSLQSCVSAATDTTAIKSCEEQAHAANGAHEKKC